MKLRFIIALSALAALPLAAQRNRITRPVDPQRTVVLADHVHPRAMPQFDRGAVDAAFPLNNLSLVLVPSAEQQAALENFLAEAHDPASPNYQKWLTPQEFADRFGPSLSDYEQVRAYLQSQGFTIHTLAPSRNWIAFDGTAATVQQAFHTEIHRFLENGEQHFANAQAPRVPEAIEGLVAGIRGLHDFLLRPPQAKVEPAYTSGSGNHYLAPDDIATIYNVNSLYSHGYNGAGQKIVVAGQTAINITDIQNFRSMFGLAPNDPQIMLVPGRTDPGTVTNDMVEADLDLEWAGAVARNASVIYVYSGNVIDAVQYAVSQNLAPVISLSYGGCETGGGGNSLRTIAQQANAQGITWIASSGDSGAAGCESSSATVASHGPGVELPASIPEVTAVGGTRFNEGSGSYWNTSNGTTLASALSYIPETSWNDTTSGGTFSSSGGGASAVFAKPGWQAGAGVPADGARDVPDVSLTASAQHDGALFCNAGACANGISGVKSVVGGTSLSAPIFAGIATLINHYRTGTGAQAQAGLGNMNPSMYSLAQTSTDAFHDITSGNNIVACRVGTTGCTTGTFGFSAGPGYDQVTGLGTVDAYRLATEWHVYTPAPAALVSVTVTPATVTGGAAATLTVNLSAAAPAAGATVSLSSTNSAFPVPATIPVAGGKSSASVPVQSKTVTAAASGTVTAAYLSVSKSASVTVAPVVLPSLTSVSISPTTLAGGGIATVTITLSGNAPSAATVTLSSNSTAFPVPASVTVAAGQSTATLRVQTASVTASTAVTVTASYLGVSKTGTTTLTALVAPALSSISISPTTLAGGGIATVTITLSGVAPSAGSAVTLSSNSTAFPVPASVTVAAGQSTATLRVQTASVTASTAVTVTASYLGVSKTGTTTLTAVVAPALSSISTSSSSVTGGTLAIVAVNLSSAALTGGAAVTLGSNSSAFPVPASVTVPAGQSSVTLLVQTTSVSASTPVTLTATYLKVSKTANVTLTPVVAPTVVSVTVSPASITSGSTATFTITLSGPTPAGGTSLTLTSSNPTAFPLPSPVTMPAGYSSGYLRVRTGTVTAATPVTVSGAAGTSSQSTSVTVTPATK